MYPYKSLHGRRCGSMLHEKKKKKKKKRAWQKCWPNESIEIQVNRVRGVSNSLDRTNVTRALGSLLL